MITPNTTTTGITIITVSESLDDDDALVCCWPLQLQDDWGVAVIVMDEILVVVDIDVTVDDIVFVTVVADICSVVVIDTVLVTVFVTVMVDVCELVHVVTTDVWCTVCLIPHDVELATSVVVPVGISSSSITWFITTSIKFSITAIIHSN